MHAARRANSEEHLLKTVCSVLNAMLRRVSVSRGVAFFLDGPAPLAKLATQRSRRMKRSVCPGGFDAAAISPGSAKSTFHISVSLLTFVHVCVRGLLLLLLLYTNRHGVDGQGARVAALVGL